MSAYIKRQIASVKDNIYFLKHERNELHYQIYVCYHIELLYEYELTLKELDNQYDQLERLERKYKIELSKERYKRTDESYKRAKDELHRTLETFTSQVKRLVHLENAKKDEISTEIEHVEDTYTEDPIKKLKEVENKEVIRTDQEEEETELQLDLYKTRGRVFSKKGRKREDDGLEGIISDDSTIVSLELKGSSHDLVMITSDNIEGLEGIILDDSTTVLLGLRGSSHNFMMITGDNIINDIIEVEHIDFIIPEYVLEPPSLVDQFSKFFAPQPFFKVHNFYRGPISDLHCPCFLQNSW